MDADDLTSDNQYVVPLIPICKWLWLKFKVWRALRELP